MVLHVLLGLAFLLACSPGVASGDGSLITLDGMSPWMAQRLRVGTMRGGGPRGPNIFATAMAVVPDGDGGQRQAWQTIPKGWIHCKPFNDPIKGTRLLSMKAPLDSSFKNRSGILPSRHHCTHSHTPSQHMPPMPHV